MIALREDVATKGQGAARRSGGRGALMADTVRAEFIEMPCLALTLQQAKRLWSLDDRACRLLLDGLLREGFLRLTADGVYRRAAD